MVHHSRDLTLLICIKFAQDHSPITLTHHCLGIIPYGSQLMISQDQTSGKLLQWLLNLLIPLYHVLSQSLQYGRHRLHGNLHYQCLCELPSLVLFVFHWCQCNKFSRTYHAISEQSVQVQFQYQCILYSSLIVYFWIVSYRTIQDSLVCSLNTVWTILRVQMLLYDLQVFAFLLIIN